MQCHGEMSICAYEFSPLSLVTSIVTKERVVKGVMLTSTHNSFGGPAARFEEREDARTPRAPARDGESPSNNRSLSSVIGSSRMRLPVGSNTALSLAAGV